jgi:chemotaxis protein CheX
MKKVYIDPFLKAVEMVTGEYFQDKVEKKDISLEKTLSLDESKEVVVALGIKGQLKGIVVIGMSRRDAVRLSSRLLSIKGMNSSAKWNEMSKSVIQEFGNNVVGRVAKFYGEIGINCDITTPTFITPEQIKNYAKESVRFELKTNAAEMVVKLHIEEK